MVVREARPRMPRSKSEPQASSRAVEVGSSPQITQGTNLLSPSSISALGCTGGVGDMGQGLFGLGNHLEFGFLTSQQMLQGREAPTLWRRFAEFLLQLETTAKFTPENVIWHPTPPAPVHKSV